MFENAFVMPYIASKSQPALQNLAINLFDYWVDDRSRADACYTVLSLPGLIPLNDSQAIAKSVLCDRRHAYSSADLAEGSRTLRRLWRSSDLYDSDPD